MVPLDANNNNLNKGHIQIGTNNNLTASTAGDGNLSQTAPTYLTGFFGNAASSALTSTANQYIRWTRSATGLWTCATNVSVQYRPKGCSA